MLQSDNKQISFTKFKGIASPPLDPQAATTCGEENNYITKYDCAQSFTLTKFDKLVEEIKKILGPSSGLDSADVDVENLKQVLRDYDQSNEIEWNKYALNDLKRNYTRNGVDDINHKANLLILVWNPEKGSAIHDHANAHCVVKVLKGTLRETLYEWPQEGDNSGTMKEKRSLDYQAGGVTYMNDQLGLHRMYNPDPNNVAVSLHLYTPPYAAKFGCQVFNEKTGVATKVPTPLYSNKGVKL